jgi:Skp family chaperone for outer membrane proteins
MNKSYWTGFLSGTTVIALGMVVVLAGSGFQGANMKLGIVDSERVFQGIEISRNYQETQKNLITERQNILAFLDTHRVMKKDDIEKFKTLSLKATKTDAEKAELEKIKTSAANAKKRFDELQFKSSPTDADLKEFNTLKDMQAEAPEVLQKIANEFQREIEQSQSENAKTAFEVYKAAVADVGKKQGFTVIFDSKVVPYAANDSTDEVIKSSTKK